MTVRHECKEGRMSFPKGFCGAARLPRTSTREATYPSHVATDSYHHWEEDLEREREDLD